MRSSDGPALRRPVKGGSSIGWHPWQPMWTISSRPTSWCSERGVQTSPAWQETHPASDILAGRIGVSRYFCGSQSHFSRHCRASSSDSGVWPARANSVARSRPPWQVVQPKRV